MDKTLPNRAIEWQEQTLILLDQRALPHVVEFLHITTVEQAVHAIQDMVVRGAPAIGITAAYAVVLSALTHRQAEYEDALLAINNDIALLADARPTAVNLHWALQRMQQCMLNNQHDWLNALEMEASNMHAEDIAANKQMGQYGAAFLQNNTKVMTHCNAGALATGGFGTALGVIRSAFADNKIDGVIANETRPWLQGSRLTAWELMQDNIPVELVCDSAAASTMQSQCVDWIIVGADRVAANGDVANKIGTYGLAIMARHLGKKFMVAAPTSTIDMKMESGADIEIEVRSSKELTNMGEQQLATKDVNVWNPVFDVTPADLIDVLVTEKGAIEQPNRHKIEQLMKK